MNISDYQIHNVLKVLSKQLARTERPQPGDEIKLSVVENRKAVIDKVADDIVKRISKYDPEADGYTRSDASVDRILERRTGIDEMEFVYFVIDENNRKKTNTLSVENPGFLILH